MPKVRISNLAAYRPEVLGALEHPDADERSVNEVFGFMVRWVSADAVHHPELLSYARAINLAGWAANADRLIEVAEYAGYIVEVESGGQNRTWILNRPSAFVITGDVDQ